MKKTDNIVKLRYVLLAIAMSLVLSYSCKNVLGDVYDLMNLNSNFSCETPLVILGDGTDQKSTVYANNTSAKITIDATSNASTYNYSLNIVNNYSSLWDVRLECFDYVNVSRVNTTIVLHDNSTLSEQISLSGGNMSQTGNYYNLIGDSMIHVGIIDLVEASSEGATILQVYLRMRIPNTMTDTLYIITFEFI
jgi:hypothetical protein